MDDRILELTEKMYQEGILKVREEAATILEEATLKANAILADAHKKADEIISNSEYEALEIKKNTIEEIRQSSHQALNALKQKIAGLITLKISEQPLKLLLEDKDYLSGIISNMLGHWEKSDREAGFNLELPASMAQDTENIILQTIHKQFGKKVEIEFSHKIKSGFRISPEGSNYIISFTEQDFVEFFSQFLRPKTIKILYQDDPKQ